MRTLSDTFSVELERSNGATHLRLAGRFDVAATRVLDDAIAVIRRRDVILDLEAVTFMDGAAWLGERDRLGREFTSSRRVTEEGHLGRARQIR